jgi:hypothetical protein
MRRAFLVMVGAAILALVPAGAASLADEPVRTLKGGERIPLTTVFDKNTTYTVTMSGVISIASPSSDGTVFTQYYDPIYALGSNSSCANAGKSAYLRIEATSGVFPSNLNTAGTPACNSSHTYTFLVNPAAIRPAYHLNGKAYAWVAVGPSGGATATGAFRLAIKSAEPMPTTVHFQFQQGGLPKGYKGKVLLDTRTVGKGTIRVVDTRNGYPHGPASGTAVHIANYASLDLEDDHLVFKLRNGVYREGKTPHDPRVVGVTMDVVRSNDGQCKPGAIVELLLSDGRGAAPDNIFLDGRGGCRAFSNRWEGTKRVKVLIIAE